MLGLLAQAVYEQGEITVSDHDVLVLYSDGLVEAANQSDVEFGEDRLIAAVEASWSQPVREIQQKILHGVRGFIGTCELRDDLTLLVARVGRQQESLGAVSAELSQFTA